GPARRPLGKDYNTISASFSQVEQKTVEQYFISYRIRKVKELLVYSSLSLSDIAFRLNFSSVAHLSKQFRQYTGLTTSHFKTIRAAKLRAANDE
ncbi:MAG TPA: helix-turn-helix domain-containing protein, partial [Chitinophagaceae bacterium]